MMTDTMITTFLTFAAFVLALLSFIKRIVVFRLNAGAVTMKGLFRSLIALAVIALLALTISSISAKHLASWYSYLASLSTDITYQSVLAIIHSHYSQLSDFINISWNVVLVSIILYLFYKLSNPIRFNKKNAQVYLEECAHIIASGVETEMMQLTNEVACSIHDIFQSATNTNCRNNKYAIQLITLFSDEMFCRLIIKHNPTTLYIIFEAAINNCDIDFGAGKQLVRRLIGLLFTENQSLLNREEPYFGLGRFGTFKKLIFGDYKFLTSRYSPLSGWKLFCEPGVNPKAIKKYFEVVEYALQSYLEKGDKHPTMFFAVMNEISEIIGDSSNHLRGVPDDNTHALSDYKILTECFLGLSSLIRFIRTNSTLFPVAPNIVKEGYSYFKNDNNIYGALSGGIFEAIEKLSISTCKQEAVRLLLIEIFFESLYSPDPLQPFAERIELLLIEKIDQNLINGYYPAVTANLIYALGLCEPDKAINTLHKELLNKLKSSFIKLHTTKPKIALDMLPTDTSFDAGSKKLVRKHHIRFERNGEIEELMLED